MSDAATERSEALLGAAALARLATARILLVGVGGVGGWCAEALVRTGARRLTLVDDDVVQISNLNRQLAATRRTIGRPKVEALRERLLEIAPEAEIEALAVRWGVEGAPGVELHDFACVLDAIDSVPEKAALIRAATAADAPLCSSMGAALRTDPTRVLVSPFAKVVGDGLARALRRRFRRDGVWPAASFACVHTDEPPRPGARLGSIMPVTAAFGMALAAWALKRICVETPATV